MGTRFRFGKLPRLVQRGAEVDLLDVLPLLTVLLLLTSAPDIWYLHTPLLILCITGLVFRSAARTPAFWYVAATLLGATIYLNWESTDNHKYLICYWCLALCCVFSLPPGARRPALRTTSRWLLGLCMIFATLWKVATPDYMSGDFFQFTLLLDERFEYFARWAGGVTETMLRDNRELKDLLTSGYVRGIEVNVVQLKSTLGVDSLAVFMTCWTIFIEGLAGALFLWPDGRRVRWLRNSVLLVFAVTTYAVATVRGFGWILMMLGLAQSRDEQKRFRLCYVAVFLLIQLYTLPIGPAVERVRDVIAPKSCCQPSVAPPSQGDQESPNHE